MQKQLLAASVLAGLLVPAAAQAKLPPRQLVQTYLHDYHAVRSRDGARVAGCNLIQRRGSCHVKATAAGLEKSDAVLKRDLTPPTTPLKLVTFTPTVVYPSRDAPVGYSSDQSALPTISYTTSNGSCGGDTPYSGGGQCWAIPYSIVQCESGGQNVPNSTGSGANGYYQLMSGGTGSKAQQDAAASHLWNGGAGAGNWVCKG